MHLEEGRRNSSRNKSDQSRLSGPLLLFFVAVFVIICFFHLFRLNTVPRGLFVDESSIGYNAVTLIESGHDEHGEAFPLYFKAFGEYKNPVYVYAAALLFKVWGVSTYALRLTSALWFIAALVLLAWLVRRLFPNGPAVLIYSVLAFGFMPQDFNLSRVAFEVISELSLFIGVLLGVHALFERPAARRTSWIAVGTGLLLGLSVYAYSTNRLFSPLVLLAIVALYFRRDRLIPLVQLCVAFGLSCVPLVVFMRTHPGALTGRLKWVSYLGSPTLSAGQKLRIFISHYFAHLEPRFLLLRGDVNLRHMTGVGGAVFWTVFALALVGLVFIIRDASLRHSRFIRLVIVLLLLTPVPAGLTDTESGHALRSLPLSLFFLLLSCYGFEALRRVSGRRAGAVVATCFGLLLVESTTYLVDYFRNYPAASIEAFGSAGFEEMLAQAASRHPKEILYTDDLRGPSKYTFAEFYRRTLHLPADLPLHGSGLLAVPGTCFIYLDVPPFVPRTVRVSFESRNPDDAAHLMCFEAAAQRPNTTAPHVQTTMPIIPNEVANLPKGRPPTTKSRKR